MAGQRQEGQPLEPPNDAWTSQSIPQQWQTALVVEIYKGKGALDDPNNYRPISLLSAAYKLLARILQQRLTCTGGKHSCSQQVTGQLEKVSPPQVPLLTESRLQPTQRGGEGSGVREVPRGRPFKKWVKQEGRHGRLRKARKHFGTLHHFWRHAGLPMYWKLRSYNAVFVPMIVYCMEPSPARTLQS